VYWFFVHRRLA